MHVRIARADEIERLRPRLSELLLDGVENGASVGFVLPLAAADADAFWRGVQDAVAGERCSLLVAESDGMVAGTVFLDGDTLPNQPHRATVSKLLVHSSMRRRGIGDALMAAVEAAALEAGRWLLTLDTATPEAARLYERRNWSRAGSIPDYAVYPDGTPGATTFYWKRLR